MASVSIFKCKMCGGDLELVGSQTTATCAHCGTLQTLPRLDDERRAQLHDRASHFRRNNDFDKAMGIYESILTEDSTDAEAYWSLVLCRYGIEYVEDPATRKRVPTINRAQYTSVFDDEDYRAALQYADMAQRRIYEEEAARINDIQKGILSISQREAPFDVFICYKETDAGGRRTPDSVLAQELYFQLKNEGFKVFFSRITLEDKLGSAYEPYIFAALHSAKVMVVLGTKPEHFNAVWVKNEWSRYLALVKQSGGKKLLIPAYRDMDAYSLPDEFSHLQAQDMSKLGFMQDLVRGIKKLVVGSKIGTAETEGAAAPSAATNISALLDRAFMSLEDGEFDRADEFCEQVLNQDSRCVEAYLGKLMAENRVPIKAALVESGKPLETSAAYKKLMRFGDEALKQELSEWNEQIRNRLLHEKQTKTYAAAVAAMETAATPAEWDQVAALLAELGDFEDAESRLAQCAERRHECIYRENAAIEHDAEREIAEGNADLAAVRYREAAARYESIADWKDAAERADACRRKATDIETQDLFHDAEALEDYGSIASLPIYARKEALQKAMDAYRRIAPSEETAKRIAACEEKLKRLDMEAGVQKRWDKRFRIAAIAILTETIALIVIMVLIYSR